MVKVGIIGSGFGLYGLLPAFNTTKNCRVVCICGEKTKRLVNYCQSIGLTNIYTDWEKMLDSENLDAVAIAVTPGAQYKIAKAAITKGLHVFAEKPLAANYTQAKDLVNLAKKKKIINAVDFIFPEITAWQEVKKIIDKKALGKLDQIDLKWDFLSFDIKNNISSWKTNITEGGGALSFYFSHSLYYLEYFAGKILNIKSRFSYSKESINGGETGIDLLLQFQDNVTGNAHLCCDNHKLNRHQLIFTFKKGVLILENKNSVTKDFSIKIHTNGKIKQLTLPKEKEGEKSEDERVIVIKKMAARFINSIVYKREFVPSFNEGVRVQELIEKIRAKND